jgi:hypothetical protein
LKLWTNSLMSTTSWMKLLSRYIINLSFWYSRSNCMLLLFNMVLYECNVCRLQVVRKITFI